MAGTPSALVSPIWRGHGCACSATMARPRRCALTSAWSWETPNPCWARSSPCDEAARRQCRMSDARHPYEVLTPDVVLDALASVGLYGDGRLLGLSSYENRVYQVH